MKFQNHSIDCIWFQRLRDLKSVKHGQTDDRTDKFKAICFEVGGQKLEHTKKEKCFGLNIRTPKGQA